MGIFTSCHGGNAVIYFMLGLRRQVSSVLTNAGYAFWGVDFAGKYKLLAEAADWSGERRNQWRLCRLNQMLKFAWDYVPFYQQYWSRNGVSRQELRDLAELERYPIVTKETLRSAGDSLYPRWKKPVRSFQKATGGSTSEPFQYRLDVEHWALQEAFHRERWESLSLEYKYGDPIGVIAGGSLVPNRRTVVARIRSFAQNRLFLFGVSMNRDRARSYLVTLKKFRPVALYAYPSILFLFAEFLAEMRETLPSVRFIVTTAEMLTPKYRSSIERAFQCPVFDNYGSNDGGVESYECVQHAGFHYNDLQAIVEVGGMEAECGQPLYITNLWNRSTPFIRYANGDLANLSKSLQCACGCGYPRIERVYGRTADIISFESGESLSGPALTLIFGNMAIDGWQIAKTGPCSLEVRLKASDSALAQYRREIEIVLRHHLSQKIRIDLVKVDRLHLTSGGKLKPVVDEYSKYRRNDIPKPG